ncbi:hypothetical protein niasHS_001605 [Heterodera schachtii]|uniref:RING-type domain-containing protein n=1 Tax=Heterodera schachtii TaxID=97005 RepID=A0ABD2KDY6_HETSC
MLAVNVAKQSILKSFVTNGNWDKRKYYLAQVVPPAKYKVIIWDKLANAALLNSAIFDHLQSKHTQRQFVFAYDQKSFADYAKYFVHFANAETDERGQFLMRKNGRLTKWSSPLAKRFFSFTLTPMDGPNVIPPDGTGKFTWQKVYVRKVTEALNSVCQRTFERNTRCTINYFEANHEWKRFLRLALNSFWLSANQFYGILPRWINFFLVASFRHLINEAKQRKELGNQMEEGNAKMLGIYWEALAKAHKNGILLHRIRMADEQMVALIGQFCQIDRPFLMNHVGLIDQTTRENGFDSFCPKWEQLLNDLALLTQNDVVMRAFDAWVHSPVSDGQTRQIVQFWLKMFADWLSKERATDEDEPRGNGTQWLTSPWLPLDLCLFRQIGELFAKGAIETKFTAPKMDEQIKGIRGTLGTICTRIKGTRNDFLKGNGPQNISTLNRWKTFCANCQFQTLRNGLTIKQENNEESQGSEVTENRCLICLTNERQIVFKPCRHFCVCRECAKVIEQNEKPKCPVCRNYVEETLFIYIP